VELLTLKCEEEKEKTRRVEEILDPEHLKKELYASLISPPSLKLSSSSLSSLQKKIEQTFEEPLPPKPKKEGFSA
jgi:hypothetical protein